MYWFEDDLICIQLPLPVRCYAAYCRRVLDRSTGTIRGGSFLLRQLQRFRTGDLAPSAVKIADITVVVDPYSEVGSFGLNEMTASSDELRIMRLSISKGDTFLDVGANHGAFSLLASSIVGSEGAVIAFEPQPELVDLLKASIEANHFFQTSVYQVAVSDHDGTATFYIPRHSACAGVYKGFSGKGTYRELHVPLVRLDDYIETMKTPGQLFIKLDVEGSELPFLCGAENIIRERRPILLMEINPDSAEAGGYKVADLIGKLKELGYEKFAEMSDFPISAPFSDLTVSRMNDFRDIVVLPTAA